MCISPKLRILNSRMPGDTNGNYTSFKPNRASVVDYCKFQILFPICQIATVNKCYQVTKMFR